MDGILKYSRIPEEHEEHLRFMWQILRDERLYAKQEKREPWLDEVKFLEHTISKSGVAIDSSKVDVLLRWEQPKSVCEVRSFLGLTGYYMKLVASSCDTSQTVPPSVTSAGVETHKSKSSLETDKFSLFIQSRDINE